MQGRRRNVLSKKSGHAATRYHLTVQSSKAALVRSRKLLPHSLVLRGFDGHVIDHTAALNSETPRRNCAHRSFQEGDGAPHIVPFRSDVRSGVKNSPDDPEV